MKAKFQKFPLGTIKVNGEIGRRMNVTAEKIIDHLDIESKFACHFKKRLEKPLVPGGFVGYGMLLDAIVKAVAVGAADERMRQMKERLIEELSATQSTNGNISIFANKIGRKDACRIWDSHEQAYIIIALANDYAMHGIRNSLDTAVKLGDYLLHSKTSATVGIEQAMLMLYEYSREKRFLDYCLNEFKLVGSMDEYNRMLTVNGTCHVYTYMARAFAQLEFGRITGEYTDNLLAGVQELFRRILNGGYSSITGSCTGGNGWGELWDASQIGLGHWGETCATAYLLRNTCAMLELEGKSVYGDIYERTMYNALFAAQSPDGLLQRYFIPFNEPAKWFENETYCCPNNLRRIMFELPEAIFMRSDDGLVINLYEESSVKTEINGTSVELIQKTLYPESDKVSVRVNVSTAIEFVLYLRVPAWCHNFTITIGEEVLRSEPGQFMEIHRRWSPGDEMEINIPSRIQFIRGFAAQQNKVAVRKGPIIYGIDPVLNQLSSQELAVLSIHNFGKATYSDAEVNLGCEVLMHGARERHIRFTRFSSPERAITYLPFHDSNNDMVSEDELFNSNF